MRITKLTLYTWLLEIGAFILIVVFMKTESLVGALAVIILGGLVSVLAVKWAKGRPEIFIGGEGRRNEAVVGAVLLVLLMPLFFLKNPYIIHILTLAWIYALATMGLNIQIGSAGMVNFAHGTLFGIGAYASALLATKAGVSFWIGMPAGILTAALFGLLLGLPTLKTRDYHLSLVTIAFAYIGYLIILNWPWTGGPNGVAGVPKPTIFGWYPTKGVKLGSIAIPGVFFYYYLVLFFCGLGLIFVKRLHNSWLGLAWNAVRDDEIASRCYGINLSAAKLGAFFFGSMFAGAAGVLYAHFIGFISTENMAFSVGLLMVCMVILGGMDNVLGVIVGSLLLVIIPEKFRSFEDFRLLFYGLVLILMLIFRPQGLIPNKVRKYLFLRRPV